MEIKTKKNENLYKIENRNTIHSFGNNQTDHFIQPTQFNIRHICSMCSKQLIRVKNSTKIYP